MATGNAHDRRHSEHRFFSGMALLLLLVILVGFGRTYFLRSVLPPATPAPLGLTPLIHLHGLLFTAWVLLLLIQARLAAANRTHVHRQLGIAGSVLAALMVGVGTLVAIQAVGRGVGPSGMDPRAFLVVPLFALGLFAAFVVMGLRSTRDPPRHKRLMLLATIALLPPAIARWLLPLGIAPPVVLVVATLFLVPLVAWDLRTLGRLHPVTLWGGLLLVASGPLRIAVAHTEGWLTISDWIVTVAK